MLFGEIVIGPPGSGKTSYIQRKKDFLKRKVTTLNLDPGNEFVKFDYDIRQIYKTDDFMTKYEYGPNNAVKEILAEFASNIDEHLSFIGEDESYFLFDFPGQVEFFLVGDSLKSIFNFLKKRGMSLVVVNLFDLVHFGNQFSKVSAYLVATLSVLLLEAPQVCVVTKCDLVPKFKHINLQSVLSLEIEQSDDKFINEVMEYVSNASILNFELLDLKNDDTLLYLQFVLDSCNGYIYYNEESLKEEYKDLKDKETLLEKYCEE